MRKLLILLVVLGLIACVGETPTETHADLSISKIESEPVIPLWDYYDPYCGFQYNADVDSVYFIDGEVTFEWTVSGTIAAIGGEGLYENGVLHVRVGSGCTGGGWTYYWYQGHSEMISYELTYPTATASYRCTFDWEDLFSENEFIYYRVGVKIYCPSGLPVLSGCFQVGIPTGGGGKPPGPPHQD